MYDLERINKGHRSCTMCDKMISLNFNIKSAIRCVLMTPIRGDVLKTFEIKILKSSIKAHVS